jgi:hypothetical protein
MFGFNIGFTIDEISPNFTANFTKSFLIILYVKYLNI